LKGDFLKMVYASLNPENKDVSGFPFILFAVSKKTVPSSVQRNRVKRMMREAYRLEKSSDERRLEFLTAGGVPGQLCIAFLYMGRKKKFPGLEAFRREVSKLLRNMSLS